MAELAGTSRIFVRNLPASLSEDDFRSHFAKYRDVTDIRLFPGRRIGYVGFQSSHDASTAVKFFNKSFIRMSRISVELARPIANDTTSLDASKSAESIAEAVSSTQDVKSLKRKRASADSERDDAKLKQFLGVMQATAKTQTWQNESVETTTATVPLADDGDSDEDLQTLKRSGNAALASEVHSQGRLGSHETEAGLETIKMATMNNRVQSDKDWLRSKGGTLSDENSASMPDAGKEHQSQNTSASKADEHGQPDPEDEPLIDDPTIANQSADTVRINQYRRLYIRNLPFDITEQHLSQTFGAFGRIEEVHLPIDSTTRKPKGYAFLSYLDDGSASEAYRALDGKTYKGRLLHILPAKPKRENTLDEYAISQLPIKQQNRIRRKLESTTATHKWNPLYMNMNDVMSSISDRLGIDKAQLVDATSSDAAVKQALAETHVIQEAKAYFAGKGVDLDSFKPGQPRGDTAILVKNFPYGTSHDEIRDLFSPHGQIKSLLIPPGGTMALVEFALAAQGRSAFAALKYRRMKDTILFLEKAPKELFTASASQYIAAAVPTATLSKPAKLNAKDLLQEDDITEATESSTLFVRNLNFTTTTEVLRKTFSPLTGFATARVKTRTDVKRPGEVLSMGFGFVEFKSKAAAQAALVAMNGYSLEGYILDVRPSQRVLDHGEEQRRQETAKAAISQQTKIMVKNLPFETTKKDVRALLASYGQLRSVRVPKKFDRSARGFAFAEFTTAPEAANAMQALKSTHLLGRRLHIEYAEQDMIDPEQEIQKMQQKVGAQMDKVTVQKLTGAGRRKFNISSAQEADA